MYAVAIFPLKYGSSLKYSKFLPHKGDLLIFTAGPNTIDTPWSRHSLATAAPISPINSTSNEQAVVHAGGKQVAGYDSFIPK